MAATVKKLQMAEGVSVGAPTDLGLGSSTSIIVAYADDAAYVTGEGFSALAGSAYINSTLSQLRYYVNSAWRNAVPESDHADSTKKFLLDLTGCSTAVTSTLDFNNTASRIYTFPNVAGTVVLSTALPSSLDVASAGAVTIGASIGANNLTLGGSSSTVVVAGNLQVNGTTTVVNSTTLEVADKNILVNDGGNDASSEGAGITVERTSTNGSIIFANSAASKWKIGLAGAEVEVMDLSSTQTASGKTFTSPTLTTPVLGTPSSGTLTNCTGLPLTSGVTGVLGAANGGTGVANNAASTLTISGNFATTLAITGVTGVTLPTTGTLATLAGAEVFTNKDIDGGTATNSRRITLPSETTTNLNALTRKAGTLVYDTTTGQVKYDNGSALSAFATTGVATPTASGTVTSYFPTIQSAVSTVTNADATSTTTDGFLVYAFSTGNTNRTFTLPAASANIGRRILVKKTDSGTGTVSITRAGSDTIDGATTLVIASQYASTTLVGVSSTAWSRIDPLSAAAVAVGDPTANTAIRLNVKGQGSTSATTSLLVQDSGTTTRLQVRDDGNVYINDPTFFVEGSTSRVGMGTTSPETNLKVTIQGAGSTSGTGALRVRNSSSTSIIFCRNDGAFFTASGAVDGATSDIRLKENIRSIKKAVEKLSLLNPVTFDWKSPESHTKPSKAGFIAQEVQAVDPEWVQIGDATPEEMQAHAPDYESNPILTTQFADLQAYIVAAIKEIDERLKALESK